MGWMCGFVRSHHAHLHRSPIEEVSIDKPVLVPDLGRFHVGRVKRIHAIIDRIGFVDAVRGA